MWAAPHPCLLRGCWSAAGGSSHREVLLVEGFFPMELALLRSTQVPLACSSLRRCTQSVTSWPLGDLCFACYLCICLSLTSLSVNVACSPLQCFLDCHGPLAAVTFFWPLDHSLADSIVHETSCTEPHRLILDVLWCLQVPTLLDWFPTLPPGKRGCANGSMRMAFQPGTPCAPLLTPNHTLHHWVASHFPGTTVANHPCLAIILFIYLS